MRSWPDPIEARGDYIDGAFRLPPDPDGEIVDLNPGDPQDHVGVFPWQAARVDEAVEAAAAAFPAWRDTPFERRAEILERYARALTEREDDLAWSIAREVGKTLWSARNEARAMVAKVGITLRDGMALVRDYRPEGVKGRVHYRPRGVMAVIGPFNFPGHLPNGHIVPALATGCTVVFKPASHNPGVGQIMAECADAAGLPPGVFNLVQVPGRHAGRLASHPLVDGVLFTGSTAVGEALERLAAEKPGRICALEMGGKNAAIVLDDAPFELAVYEVLQGAFGNAGQQCTATSRVILQRGIAERFARALVELARGLKVGVQDDPEAYLGPLVDRNAAEDFQRWQAVAREEGAEVLLEGGLMEDPPVPGGAYVRPSIHRVAAPDPASRYQREELFAPDTCLYVVDTLDEAIALADDTEYGLACAILTETESAYLEVVHRVRAGIINWNQSTVWASGRLPFGGLKRSGNGHPAAVFSTLYCTYPVASLERAKTLDRGALPPGLPRTLVDTGGD